MKKYAVVVYYTFDSETCVYLFDTYEEACNYLQKMWEYCFNSEIATNESEVDFEMTYHEEDYAQIKWDGNDNPMRIWQVTAVSEPMKINTYNKKTKSENVELNRMCYTIMNKMNKSKATDFMHSMTCMEIQEQVRTVRTDTIYKYIKRLEAHGLVKNGAKAERAYAYFLTEKAVKLIKMENDCGLKFGE